MSSCLDGNRCLPESNRIRSRYVPGLWLKTFASTGAFIHPGLNQFGTSWQYALDK